MVKKEDKKKSSFIIFKEYFEYVGSLVENNIKQSQIILRELYKFQDICTFMDKCSKDKCPMKTEINTKKK